MQMTQFIRKAGGNDLKLIRRDHFLIFMLLFVIYMAVILRFGMPWLNTYLADRGVMPSATIAISLADLYPMLVVYMAIYTGALLVGTIFGFVLLDEKDDNTIKAILITPVPLNQYLLYRVGLPAILAFFIIVSMVLFINQALIPLWQLLPIAVGGSLAAPIISLFFATFAENKVQGLAYSKFAGISGWAFLIGWFVPEPWQWLIGLFPPFWVGKAYWMALEGRALWWLVLMAGVLLQIGSIIVLMRRFTTTVHR